MKQLGILLPTYPLDRMSVHPTPVTPQLSSPPPLAFYQASLTNFWYPFTLLGGEGHCEKQVLYKNKTHDLARLQMQTS